MDSTFLVKLTLTAFAKASYKTRYQLPSYIARGGNFSSAATIDWKIRKFRNNLPITGGAHGLLMGSSLLTSLSAT